MASVQLIKLSGSTDGKVIPIVATATAGTTLHTAVAGTSAIDKVFLWVSNVTGSAATLTIEYGSVTDPGGLICKAVSIPANYGPTKIIDGEILQNGLVIAAFSGTASALNASGYVLRIT